MQAPLPLGIGQSGQSPCENAGFACLYALQALPVSETLVIQTHIATCPDCQRELESLLSVIDRFVAWPTDLLRPPRSLQARLALRIAGDAGDGLVLPRAPQRSEPEWEQVAPGI